MAYSVTERRGVLFPASTTYQHTALVTFLLCSVKNLWPDVWQVREWGLGERDVMMIDSWNYLSDHSLLLNAVASKTWKTDTQKSGVAPTGLSWTFGTVLLHLDDVEIVNKIIIIWSDVCVCNCAVNLQRQQDLLQNAQRAKVSFSSQCTTLCCSWVSFSL